MRKRNTALDGLRFLAVALVVSSHCSFLRQGGLGNAIFFALSGFLAVRPFAKDKEDFKGIVKILRYYLSRIIRIVPVFWVCILGAFFLNPVKYFDIADTESFNSLLLNMFFIKSQGHLWFLQQEMFFYLIFPFLSLLLAGIYHLLSKIIKKEPVSLLIIAAFLVICSFLLNHFFTDKVFYLYGNGTKMAFRLGQFTAGMAAGYIYRAYKLSSVKISRPVDITAGIYGALFLFFCVFSAEPILSCFFPSMKDIYIGWTYPILCSILTVLFILSVTISDNIITKFMGNRLFSYIGSISFAVYLVHWYFLPAFLNDDVIKRFILLFFVSISAASIIHILVEKPSMIFAKSFKAKDIAEYYKNL